MSTRGTNPHVDRPSQRSVTSITTDDGNTDGLSSGEAFVRLDKLRQVLDKGDVRTCRLDADGRIAKVEGVTGSDVDDNQVVVAVYQEADTSGALAKVGSGVSVDVTVEAVES